MTDSKSETRLPRIGLVVVFILANPGLQRPSPVVKDVDQHVFLVRASNRVHGLELRPHAQTSQPLSFSVPISRSVPRIQRVVRRVTLDVIHIVCPESGSARDRSKGTYIRGIGGEAVA